MATKTQVTIESELRTAQGKQVHALRREGLIPARIYGHGESVMIQTPHRAFERLIETHQTTGVIALAIAGQKAPETVVVRHIEREPRSGHILHIDFFRVRMDEIMHGRVPLRLIGESPAAKISGGTTMTLLETIEIECLPGDLPEVIEADASAITSVDMLLHARDLKLPPGVSLLTSPDEPIAKIQQLRGAEATSAGETPTAAAETPATES
jgi:large subunit ribosomal protein L25